MAVNSDRKASLSNERLEGLVELLLVPHRCASPAGIGIDHVDIARIDRHVSAASLLEQITTRQERSRWYASMPPNAEREMVAEIVAFKEAAAKALGTGWGELLGWMDVSVPSKSSSPLEIDLRLDADLAIWAASLATDDHVVAVAASDGRWPTGDGSRSAK